jgi:hypothetical protein
METSRYQLVDSLYGPGTVGAWLLTLTAVLISWTLNRNTRHKDTISIDFIGVLVLPLVAAGHLAWQVYRLPYSIIETITSTDVEVQKYAAALEAPLNICETFSMVALLAAAACGPWWNSGPKLRRLGAVLGTGVTSWGMENLMFAAVTVKGVEERDATLSRPCLFWITPIVAITWTFLVLYLVIGALFCVIGRIDVQGILDGETDLEGIRSFWRQEEKMKKPGRRASYEATPRAMKSVSVLSTIFAQVSFLVVLTSSITSLKSGSKESVTGDKPPMFFLIPVSNGSMRDLDQVLALLGGILVLLWTIRAAYLSRKGNSDSERRVLARRRSI